MNEETMKELREMCKKNTAELLPLFGKDIDDMTKLISVKSGNEVGTLMTRCNTYKGRPFGKSTFTINMYRQKIKDRWEGIE